MGFSLKPYNVCRRLLITSRHYSYNQQKGSQPPQDDRSIYQRDEDGPQERKLYGEPYPDWRKPWIQRTGEFSSKFSLFVERNPSPDILKTMNELPDLTFQKIKDWWASMKVIKEIEDQKYIAQRVEILGSNLAAAHFLIYRGASLRFRGSDKWLTGTEEELKLPDRFKDGYFIEAIDCEQFHSGGIRYEGLMNLMDLNFLKWLSLKNNPHVDVWCLDRIAGLNGLTLEYLDISGCNISIGCVYALARMKELKMLVVTDPSNNVELQAGLSILEQENPNLLINAIPPVESIKIEN